jgi:hypothetical protein
MKKQKAEEVVKVLLPRVLVNARRGYAMEVLRGYKFAHIINADHGTISYDRVALEKLKTEWKEFSTDSAQVRKFCDVCLASFRPRTPRAASTLREIQSMNIDVAKASSQELVDFYNANAVKAKEKPIKKFADRKTAEERVTKLLASLNPASTPAEAADAALPVEATSTDSSTTSKGNAMSKPNKTTKKAAANSKPTKADAKAKKSAAKKPAAAKKSAAKKPKAGTIADGVKASWADKKVAAARSLKHKVKVGGQVYRSCAEAFTKLKLDFSKCVKFRRELKLSPNGRATFEGKQFSLVHDEG